MNDVIERILSTYSLMRPMNEPQLIECREKMSGYLEKLTAAGHTDSDQLAVFGLAYLKEMHEGPSPRYTGC
jgi:uncharacterized protein HemX